MQPDDPWSRVDYRRLVAWPERIAREWPFLERCLEPGLILDLGSGTGEHSRHLAAHGYEVLGIEASPSMLAKASEAPLPPNLRFAAGDIVDVGRLAPAGAAGAICLGNTLPHLDETGMRTLAEGLARTLKPGAPFVFQALNYERIRARKLRYLPLNFRPFEDGEIVFLRLMETHDDGWVTFTPTTLRYDPAREPPVEVTSARSIRLYGWTWPELRAIFGGAGFSTARVYGGFDSSPFDAAESNDVIGVLRR